MTNNWICTTTINAPTEAIREYDRMDNWNLFVVGDRKTPEYKLDRGEYMSWEEQQKKYPDLCELIGPDSVARGRMIAWIEAYRRGAEVVASIDDDIWPHYRGALTRDFKPYWGDIYVGRQLNAIEFKNRYERHKDICFEPFGRVYRAGYIPPARGYPMLNGYKHPYISEASEIDCLVQVNLCNGEADFNAVSRVENRFKSYRFDSQKQPFFSDKFSPINTQNTIIHRSALRHFPANIPFIGRADDIWAGYIFQAYHRRSTIYAPANAQHWQRRSNESILSDLENEIFMYRNTYNFLLCLSEQGPEPAMKKFLPAKSVEAIKLYQSYFK